MLPFGNDSLIGGRLCAGSVQERVEQVGGIPEHEPAPQPIHGQHETRVPDVPQRVRLSVFIQS